MTSVAIIPTSDELNYVIANGVKSPGRAQISGLVVPQKWKIQEQHGSGQRPAPEVRPDLPRPVFEP